MTRRIARDEGRDALKNVIAEEETKETNEKSAEKKKK